MDILKYKDYEGSAELDMARLVCRGKILFIDDLITFEAAAPTELQKEFESAVDDYIETCAILEREAQRPFKGQFNVRAPPALHRAAAMRALADDVSLNDVVVQALKAFVGAPTEINHNVRVTLDIPESSMEALASSVAAAPEWRTFNATVRH